MVDESHTAFFAISTQIYVRLRRVTGRVVDALYMVQNADYAQYVLALAKDSQDPELLKYIERLYAIAPNLAPQSGRLQAQKSAREPLKAAPNNLQPSPEIPQPPPQEQAAEPKLSPEEAYERRHSMGFLR
jgi:hypothetical protein